MSGQFIYFNGWISICTDPYEESFDNLARVVDDLTRFMKSMQFDNQIFEIKPFNIHHVLLIGGCHNHDVGYSDSIFALLEKVGELAPASHGVVFIR